MFDPRKFPFSLSETDVTWVDQTLAALTDDEKIGQLFCLIAYSDDEQALVQIAKDRKAGGLMARPMPLEAARKTAEILQANAKVPMLIAANLEKGGDGVVVGGTQVGSPMLVAATGDPTMAHKLGTVAGREGSAAGVNWSFSPIVDLDLEFHNPITNTRTFGSNPSLVAQCGAQYVRGVQAQGVAASLKHFPGDGVDERDQHLVTTVNTMSCEQWDQTFGEVYRTGIEAGALTVMAGHIALPEYSRRLSPGLADSDILPASLSPELLQGLLRDRLGFQGLIVSDSTTMAGLAMALPRPEIVPRIIQAGCDMFLFTRNADEDYGYMKAGLASGLLTRERLDDAVRRILSLKAALGLHRQRLTAPSPQSIGAPEHREWARECAAHGITLVKQEPGVLPLSAKKTPRVLFYGLESAEGWAFSVRTGAVEQMEQRFRKEGFDVTVFDPAKGMEGMMTPFGAVVAQYDLIVYVANLGTRSNQTTVRIEWAMPMGANVPIFGHTIPTIFLSVENPYHLIDVPRVRTYINAYSSADHVQEALMDRLMGRASFEGKSPVDAFCGRWDTRL